LCPICAARSNLSAQEKGTKARERSKGYRRDLGAMMAVT